ncbi:hypothetical protein C8T65DRAFT_701807 [Cerioporus squamosus]|nr:hypothetical protein C8T65DRAFT_701807 [Cerioporus squamosus]
MLSNPTRELEQLEGSSSSAPSFTFAEIFEMWLHIQEQYSAESIHPDDPIRDPCPHCMRRTLANLGHLHLPENFDHNHSHGSGASASDTDDAHLWEQVSPESTFLAEHLPPTLGAPGPRSTSTPLSTRIIRDFASSAPPMRPPTPGGSVTRRIQVPDCAICPRHGPILTNCPTHGVTTTVRRAPLVDASNVAGPSGTVHADDDSASLADTMSVLNSFTSSLSGTDSLYGSPEQVTTPLPAAGAAAPAGPATAPVLAIANMTPAAAAAPAVPAAAVVPAPVVPAATIAAPAATIAAPAPAVANTAPGAAVPAVAVNPVAAPPAPAAPDGPPYVAYMTPHMNADNYYVVTRGRTVGVFDSWAKMVASTSKISGGTGRGGFHSWDAAIAAFRDAEEAGIVVQRDD